MDSNKNKKVGKIWEIKQRAKRIPALGIILALLSGIILATSSLIVTLLKDIHPIEVLVISTFIQFLVFGFMVLYNGQTWTGVPGERMAIVFRCISGPISMSFIYISLRLIDLGDASTIIFSAPVYVSVFAYIFLKEPFGIFQVFTIILSLIGVILISKPSFIFMDSSSGSEKQLEGVIFAFLASISISACTVVMRKIQKTPASTTIALYALTTTVTGSIALFYFDGFSLPNTLSSILLLLGNGFCTVFYQLFLTLALKYEDAGPVSLVRTIDIVIAFIYQVTILGEAVSLMSFLGASLVSFCVVSSALMKLFKEKPHFKGSLSNVFKKKKIEKIVGISYIPTIADYTTKSWT